MQPMLDNDVVFVMIFRIFDICDFILIWIVYFCGVTRQTFKCKSMF